MVCNYKNIEEKFQLLAAEIAATLRLQMVAFFPNISLNNSWQCDVTAKTTSLRFS